MSTLSAFRELWTKENPSFNGKYCNFSDIIFLPKPVQKPTIPIWIGGHSKQALRRAGELGDGWHPIGGVPTIPLEPEDVARRSSRCSPDTPKRREETLKTSAWLSKDRCSIGKNKLHRVSAGVSWAALRKLHPTFVTTARWALIP